MLSIYNVQHIQTAKVSGRASFKIPKKEASEVFLEMEKIFRCTQKKIF